MHVTQFVQARAEIASAGDDGTVRHWDMARGAQLSLLAGHQDRYALLLSSPLPPPSVRALAVSPVEASLWASGAYDHTVKLWDARSAACTASFALEAPVEALSFYASGTLLAVAAGPLVKVRPPSLPPPPPPPCRSTTW